MLKKITLLLLGTLFFSSMAFADSQQANTQQTAGRPSDAFVLYNPTPNAIKPADMVYSLKPGDTVKDSVQLKNFAEQQKTFELYIGDRIVFNTKTHTVAYTSQGQPSNMSKWITFDSNSVTLKAEEEKTINYTITIPKDLPLGTYEGGIGAVFKRPAASMPNLTIATQYVLGIEINVTNNPQPVPRLTTTYTYLVFGPTPYLIGSALLFLCCIGYYIYASRKEKKAKKLQAGQAKPQNGPDHAQAHGHGHAHDHEHEHKHEHPEHHHDHPEHPKK